MESTGFTPVVDRCFDGCGAEGFGFLGEGGDGARVAIDCHFAFEADGHFGQGIEDIFCQVADGDLGVGGGEEGVEG